MSSLSPGTAFWSPSSAVRVQFTTKWGGRRHPLGGSFPDLENWRFKQAGWPPIRVRVLSRTVQYKR